ncbi:hypothetical protein ZU61_12220 [Salmonella enterica subsp. enterica serovar Thompson]|nr:hypothetical protein [Salmonella enterica subsp. enterica serovar Thompson]
MMDTHCLFKRHKQKSSRWLREVSPTRDNAEEKCHPPEKITVPTGNHNGKSVKLCARVPLDLANDIEELKEDSESVTTFLIQALQTEAERRKEIKRRTSVSGWT